MHYILIVIFNSVGRALSSLKNMLVYIDFQWMPRLLQRIIRLSNIENDRFCRTQQKLASSVCVCVLWE